MAVNKLEIIECAIEQLDKKEPEMIKNMLIQFMKENLQAPKAKKNLSVFDFVATDKEELKIRPVMGGVFMDKKNKVAVATDGHVMMVSKSEYKANNFKSGIITKDGKTIPGKYVNYEFVLNQYKDIKHIKLYDEKTLIDMALITQAEWELMDGLTAPCIPITPDKDCAIDFFPIRRLPILLSVGLEGWMHDKCAFLYEDDDKKIFIMSVVTSEHYTNRVINEK